MRCLLILLLILGNVTEGAAVEIPTVDPAADRELAKQHYESGKDAFTEGRFATAMLEFEAAYKLSKEPLLIENMAITAEKMGDTANAIALSRKFLTLAPKDGDAEAVATATKRIERLTVPERTPQAVAPAPTPTPAPAAARRPGPALRGSGGALRPAGAGARATAVADETEQAIAQLEPNRVHGQGTGDRLVLRLRRLGAGLDCRSAGLRPCPLPSQPCSHPTQQPRHRLNQNPAMPTGCLPGVEAPLLDPELGRTHAHAQLLCSFSGGAGPGCLGISHGVW